MVNTWNSHVSGTWRITCISCEIILCLPCEIFTW